MKVICIKNKGWERLPLTIGKMYEVIDKMNIPFSPSRYDDPSGPFYKIKCDTGEERHFDPYNFRELTLDEKRDLKLQELLDGR
jgi:hypothetical protein